MIAFGIPYTLIVFGLAATGQSFKFFEKFDFLGNASYSIYLTHFITMMIGVNILNNTGIGILGATMAGLYIEFCLFVGLCVAVGLVAYQVVEKPLVKYLSQIWLKRSVTAP